MSGFAAPARTATPSPTRATSDCAGGERRPRRVVPHDVDRNDGEVERAARGHLYELRGRAIANDELVTGRLLELRRNLFQWHRNASARNDLQVSGQGWQRHAKGRTG